MGLGLEWGGRERSGSGESYGERVRGSGIGWEEGVRNQTNARV